MDLTGKLIIKVALDDDVRRIPIHNEEITYDELILMMQRVFRDSLEASDGITLKYKDDDGDLITIFDSSDLSLAIQMSRVLRLTLFVEGREKKDKEDQVMPGHVREELRAMRDKINSILDRWGDQSGGDSAPNANNLDVKSLSLNDTNSNSTATNGGSSKEFDPLQQQQQQLQHQQSEDQQSVSDRSSVSATPTAAVAAAPPMPQQSAEQQQQPAYPPQQQQPYRGGSNPPQPQPQQHQPGSAFQPPQPQQQQPQQQAYRGYYPGQPQPKAAPTAVPGAPPAAPSVAAPGAPPAVAPAAYPTAGYAPTAASYPGQQPQQPWQQQQQQPPYNAGASNPYSKVAGQGYMHPSPAPGYR